VLSVLLHFPGPGSPAAQKLPFKIAIQISIMGGRHGDFVWGNEAMRRVARHLLRTTQYAPLYFKYRRFTMLGQWPFMENLALVAHTLSQSALADGWIVECGTWRGGMAAGLIEIGGMRRRYLFCDSFAGLPPARDIDGEAAKRWQAETTSPRYYNNAAASLQEFEQTIRLTKIPFDQVSIKKGYFSDTFHTFQTPPVSVLRLDADWYDSTMECLEKFWDYVIPGGLIIVDDYDTFDGCCRAVHQFLASREATERIEKGPVGRVPYMIKR
jgi:O-methyltransferase